MLLHSGEKGFVRVQEPQCRPPGRELPAQLGPEDRLQDFQGVFQGGEVADALGLRVPGEDGLDRFHQGAEAPAAAGAGPHRRDPQFRRELCQVHPDAFFLRFVHEVDADHGPAGELQDLEDQVQVPLQGGGVADDDGCVGLPEAEEVPGRRLLRRLGKEGVGPGEVHQGAVEAAVCTASAGVGHGFSGPVAGVLLHAGEGVEHGAFPHVGVSGQGDYRPGAVRLRDAVFHSSTTFLGNRFRRPQPRQRTGATAMRALSQSRRATTAPRMA